MYEARSIFLLVSNKTRFSFPNRISALYYGCKNITNLPMHILCYLANSLKSFEYVESNIELKLLFIIHLNRHTGSILNNFCTHFIYTHNKKTFPTENIFVCKLCCKRHYLMMVKLKHLDTNILLNTRLISRNGQCAMIYRKWRKLP